MPLKSKDQGTLGTKKRSKEGNFGLLFTEVTSLLLLIIQAKFRMQY